MEQTTGQVSSSSNSEVTWRIAAIFWWAWLWRTMLAAVGGGFVLGFVMGIVGLALGFDTSRITGLAQIIGGLFGCFVSIYFIKAQLNKDFKSFKVIVVRK